MMKKIIIVLVMVFSSILSYAQDNTLRNIDSLKNIIRTSTSSNEQINKAILELSSTTDQTIIPLLIKKLGFRYIDSKRPLSINSLDYFEESFPALVVLKSTEINANIILDELINLVLKEEQSDIFISNASRLIHKLDEGINAKKIFKQKVDRLEHSMKNQSLLKLTRLTSK